MDSRRLKEELESNSITHQKQILEDYCKKNGIRNYLFFADDGISGTTFNRPDFKKMDKMIESGEIGTVIVKDLSRFGRDHVMSGYYLQIKYPSLGVNFISLQENVDIEKDMGTDMLPIHNVFNEWYAQQTSKKIRAVWQNKRDRGERVSPTVPYGYKKAKKDTQWYIDEPAAEVVRYIFKLAMEGLGPTKIANRLREEKYITPTEYFYQINRKTRNERPVDPYNWQDTTVKHILDNPQYTGCTVNGRSSIVSYKVHKKIEYDESEWQIIPNTQEAIIDEETFKTVHEMRASRRRNTATGRTSLFSNLVFCGDCGSKMYFCAAKSINENQEFFRCSAYKENRGTCTIHFIRNVVLEEMVLETVRKTAKYISENETVFLYLYEKNHRLSVAKEMRDTKLRVEQAKKRIKELDGLISASFEQLARGTISEDDSKSSVISTKQSKRSLQNSYRKQKPKSRRRSRMLVDLKAFLENIRECTDIQKLTPTLVNTLIKKIEIFNSVKGRTERSTFRSQFTFGRWISLPFPTKKKSLPLWKKSASNPTNVA
jgi:Site-specific recombinases, DNA invertase Pin homologs